MDDFWYKCPGSQGPDVDSAGRWVTDGSLFPGSGGKDGMQVLADYAHSKGLKFGLYVTPGISAQAVSKKTKIEGSSHTADEIATGSSASNFNCKGMRNIDYSKPGAQQFINSWADQFASWGVGLPQAGRGRAVEDCGRAGLVGGARAGRPPDGVEPVGEPVRLERPDLERAGQLLADRR